MRHYEATIVLDPSLTGDGHGRQIDRIQKTIEKAGGTNLSEDRWGVRTLAYPIGKHDQGFYTVLHWEGPGEMIAEVDQLLRLDENVLRHLIIHLDAMALEAQEEMRQRRAAGEDRDNLDDDEDEDDEDEDEDEDEDTRPRSGPAKAEEEE